VPHNSPVASQPAIRPTRLVGQRLQSAARPLERKSLPALGTGRRSDWSRSRLGFQAYSVTARRPVASCAAPSGIEGSLARMARYTDSTILRTEGTLGRDARSPPDSEGTRHGTKQLPSVPKQLNPVSMQLTVRPKQFTVRPKQFTVRPKQFTVRPKQFTVRPKQFTAPLNERTVVSKEFTRVQPEPNLSRHNMSPLRWNSWRSVRL
jgi:hypothetical protein